MHDDLKSFRQKPVPKIAQKLQNFEKPQILSKKSQKLGQKTWNTWQNERKRIIPEEEINLETKDWVGKWFGVRERCLGRWEVWKDRERSRRNERNVVRTLFIEILDSWWIKRCQELSRIKMREIAIEELLRSYREVSTTYNLRWIEKLSSIYWACRNFLDGSRSYR